MNPADIPYNTSFHINDDLRDVPDDPEDMARAIAFLDDRLRIEQSDAERRSLFGLIGVLSRMTGDLDRAESALQSALRLAIDEHDRAAIVQSQIRLAHVFQWQQRFVEADTLYVATIEMCSSDDALGHYLDFALQHYGKSLFDQRSYEAASRAFEKALHLRCASGNNELIASSRQALDAARARSPR